MEIPKDVAERLYKRYAATLINPAPLDEMVLTNGVAGFRAIYEKGIVKPGEQLFWIWHAHKKNADLSEPYDVGVLNALALAMYIFSDKEHLFWEKPEGLRFTIDILEQKVKGLQERLLVDQKNYADKLAEQTKNYAAEIAKLKEEIKTLEAQLKETQKLLKTDSEDDKP